MEWNRPRKTRQRERKKGERAKKKKWYFKNLNIHPKVKFFHVYQFDEF